MKFLVEIPDEVLVEAKGIACVPEMADDEFIRGVIETMSAEPPIPTRHKGIEVEAAEKVTGVFHNLGLDIRGDQMNADMTEIINALIGHLSPQTRLRLATEAEAFGELENLSPSDVIDQLTWYGIWNIVDDILIQRRKDKTEVIK